MELLWTKSHHFLKQDSADDFFASKFIVGLKARQQTVM